MKKFMQTHKVYLTPLSPIHIGCGEDFEPTNYIIEQDLLYYFEPSKLNINSQSDNFRELFSLASKGDYEGVKKFFIKNKNLILDSYISNYQALIPAEFKNEWENKSIIQNRLEIERNAYLPHPFHQPYIPSSGVKGAIATAVLDYEHNKNAHIEREKTHNHLLEKHIGLFKDSDFRFIKFSDFIPTNKNVLSQVFYAVNFEKFEDDLGGLSVRRECIIDRQYRSFSSDLTFTQDRNDNFVYLKDTIIDRLNKYYTSTFKKEMEILIVRKLVSKQWFEEILELLNGNNIALIRLGKNGSDSKVYQDKSIVRIKTKKEHKRKQKPIFETLSESTTIWLARENNKSKEKVAFGWALLEFDTTSENKLLLDWCNKKTKPIFNRNEFLSLQKQKQQEIKEIQEKERAEAEVKRLAEQQAESEKQALLNSLSDNQRLVEAKLAEWEKQEKKQFTVSPIFAEAKKLLEEAQQWNKDDRHYLYEKIDPTKLNEGLQKYVDGLSGFSNLKAKSAVEFKKLRNKLVAE